MTEKKRNKKEEKLNNRLKRVTTPNSSNSLLMWVCVAAIALITYVVFLPSLDNGFTNWDDGSYVTENPLVVNNSVPLAEIFKTPVSLHYHPLTILSLALNYQTGKLDPSGYHLENVILHVLNTLLVFLFVFLLMRRNLLMAVIVSLFFGIHPMHVESVSWISERKDVLYVFFFMAGLISYLRYSETKKKGWYIFTFLLFVFSCLSKEMAIIFPAILLLVDYLKGIKWERRVFVEKIPFVVISILIGIMEIKIQAGNAGADVKIFTAFQRLMFASYSAIMYVVRLFVPYKLSAFYPYPDTLSPNGIPMIFYLSPFILIGILCALIYLFLKKQKEIVFGLLFYFVSIVLVVQFIPVGPAMLPDRYSYLAYIGLLFIVAHLINKLWNSKSRGVIPVKYAVAAVIIVGAVVFSVQTYSRTQVWKNSEVLWTDVIDNYPTTSEAFDHRAEYYYDNDEAEKALPDYNEALQLSSTDRDAYYNRGLLYATYYKKDNLALADYTEAIAIDSTFRKAYFNRALLYAEYGKNDLAIADYSKAIKLDPDYSSDYTNRGLLYLNTGRAEQALADFNKAIAINAASADAYNDRGLLYLRNGNYDLALTDLNKAIALNQNSAPYYYNRGLCYNGINEYKKAVTDFTYGIQLNPDHVELFYNMRGTCDLNLQNYNDAVADFSKAIEINPSVAGYWKNRSFAESKTGENDKAKADAQKALQLQEK